MNVVFNCSGEECENTELINVINKENKQLKKKLKQAQSIAMNIAIEHNKHINQLMKYKDALAGIANGNHGRVHVARWAYRVLNDDSKVRND